MQAAYNLTGADLSPNNSTTRKRIQTALQKALGANVNATLLTVTAAKGAADASPSPSDASSSLHLTPADGSVAGESHTALMADTCPTPYSCIAGQSNNHTHDHTCEAYSVLQSLCCVVLLYIPQLSNYCCFVHLDAPRLSH